MQNVVGRHSDMLRCAQIPILMGRLASKGIEIKCLDDAR